MVFPHQCLPLTANLREAIDRQVEVEGEYQEDLFKVLAGTLSRAINYGVAEKELSFDYHYKSLWTPYREAKRRINFAHCSQDQSRLILKQRTHWYRRLGKGAKCHIDTLLLTKHGKLKLKEYLHTADGMLCSLLLGFPELFERDGYKLSDRILNSIITSCCLNYTKVVKDFKKIRKQVKWAMYSKLEYKVDYNFFRSYSFLSEPLQILNSMRDRSSKSKMAKVTAFCQTRATGLASKEMCKETVDEFIANVTVVKEYTPNETLCRAVDEVTSFLAEKLNYGITPEFKISASTTACRENPARKEGKFGFLREIINSEGIQIPTSLYDSPGGQIGNPLYEIAEEMADGQKSILDVNVAAVRENGKSRVITSGSFWKETLLQPYSHLTINVIKNLPELADSLQAGRLGWKFISGIDNRDADRGWILFEEKAYVLSFDWEKATDNPTHKMGRHVMGALLDKLGVPKIDSERILSVWLGHKQLYQNGAHIGTLINGIPMGDPLTKTCLSLAHPISNVYARMMTGSRSVGAGNGDDGIDLTPSLEFCDRKLECAEMLGYRSSPDDTFVTEDWGTYCEEVFHMPVSRFNTCATGVRLKNTSVLPYLDFPKIRVMIDTQKDRQDFSSDPRGKATLLGHDQEYVMNSKGPEETIFAVASAIQDVNLGLIDRPEPIYMPRQCVGIGKPPPYWSVDSWCNIINNSRHWHRKYYLRSMFEYLSGVQGLTAFRGILKESRHFEKEALVEILEIPEDDPLKQHVLIRRDQHMLFPEGVINKLITLNYLIPESKIAKYYLFEKRLQSLRQDHKELDVFESVRMYMTTLEIPETLPVRQLVTNFVQTFKNTPYSLKFNRTENLYDWTTLKRVREGDPLVVTSKGQMPVLKKFFKQIKPDSPYKRAGLELYDWFSDNWFNVLNEREYDPPPVAIIADDPVMIHTVYNGGADIFYFVTDDKKLVNLARNKVPSAHIGHISLRSWLLLDGLESAFEKESKIHFPGATTKIVVDQGSFETFLMTFDITAEFQGIPWNCDIKKENVRKQSDIYDTYLIPTTVKGLNFPVNAFDGREYFHLRRKFDKQLPDMVGEYETNMLVKQ
nr:MAG: RNA-dependent RNA polymerase [Streptophyte associated narna-like virus 16]